MSFLAQESEGDDAVSSSSTLTRFINKEVQTPQKLLRLVCEEMTGTMSRKPTDREFKVGLKDGALCIVYLQSGQFTRLIRNFFSLATKSPLIHFH